MNHQFVGSQESSNAYLSYHPSHPPISTSASWNMPRANNETTESAVPSVSGYGHNQQNQQVEFTLSKDVQVTMNTSSHSAMTSGVGTATGSHEYGYTPYTTSSDPYGHSTTGYQGQGYYYGYHQQDNQSYPQQAGAYQTSGAPYQTHTSSFQGSDSYPSSSSYSGTYYNADNYQTTSSGYQNGGYTGHANFWNGGNYGNYHQYYSNYTTADSNAANGSSSVATTPGQYQQQYQQQWANYYNQSSDVTCAPGTENILVTTPASSSVQCEIAGTSGGYYPVSSSQPPPPGTTSWQPGSSAPDLPSLQETATVGNNYDGSCSHMSPGFSKDPVSQTPSYFQKPSEPTPVFHNNYAVEQTVVPHHGATQQYSLNQFPQNFQSPSQSIPTGDTSRMSTLQIPTNPRIASTLPFGLPRAGKDAAVTDTVSQPAYISVSMPKHGIKATSTDTAADPLLKQPGTFPASLRAYVERALLRCRDDTQKAACQKIMKEIITKASSDGTLFTRNWDVEPLFPLPATESSSNDNLLSPFMLPKNKRSPSRRSRWEPLPEDKLVEKLSSVNYDPIKDVGGDNLNLRGRVAKNDRLESKFDGGSHLKFFASQKLSHQSNNLQRLVKKPRLTDTLNGATENGDASSDSEKDQGLTAYYAAAVNLANSPEERKKRENRFKRFDKNQENKSLRPKGITARTSYAKWPNTFLMSKKHEEGPGRAVEDIDWDSLTVKGTCQDIEKRYLRLTSAPDPATVRPEEVLEKALLMVQDSQKNYLYKCDQLKSIRQDLTVQRICNELTVKVYETHARLALEAGDLPEYNQCQSQLKSLYSEGIKGCNMEFAAYNLLCVIMHSNNYKDLLSSMARLSPEAKRDEAVKHALAVRAAVTSGNYVLFFRLYKTAPNLNPLLMDLYAEKMRFEAVRCMSRSYRPSVPVVYIAQVLGFLNLGSAERSNMDSDSTGLEDCVEWLRAHGANLNLDNNGEMQIDTKASSSSLYMPEPEDAVAHGDASLAVNDFLTRTS